MFHKYHSTENEQAELQIFTPNQLFTDLNNRSSSITKPPIKIPLKNLLVLEFQNYS